jgi:NifU-like protein involved in Fe-S cluster formation
MDYSSEVRRRFERADAAGPAGSEGWVSAAAEDRSLNVWIRFDVRVSGGRIREMRFGAFGCPHLIAAADRVVERLTGEPAAGLREPDIAGIARELEVPREKFGKLLRLEDALVGCANQL